MADLKELLELVEKATANDRYLFHEVAHQLVPDGEADAPFHDRLYALTSWDGFESAAFALLERVLPGANYAIDATAPELDIDFDLFPARMPEVRGSDETLSLAILTALLKALISKEAGHGK